MILNTSRRRAFAVLATALLSISCGSETSTPPPPPLVLTTINVTVPTTTLVLGQTTTATAFGKDQKGADFTTGSIAWSSSAPTIAAVNATTGVVTAIAAGTTQISATVGTITGQLTVTVTGSPAIKINEVESNGGTPGDWIELYNSTSAAVDISGWGVRDNDSTHTIYKIPAGTTIAAGAYFVVEEAQFGFGLGAPDDARLYNQYGALVETYAWTAHAATTYGRCANGTGEFTTTTSSTKGAANDCTVPLKINEVESSGGTPGDWIELTNIGAAPISVGGFIVRDDDDSHTYTIPAGTTIAPGGFYLVEEAALGFGLGAPDAARVFDAGGRLVDSYSWTAHAGVTYGRCPDGTGAFVNTAATTKGAANSCGSVASVPWFGADDVATVDGTAVFGGNLSGLMTEAAGGGAPAVLWGARNGPGAIFRLLFNGTIWAPDPANGWSAGKLLRYPDGTGDVDAEDLTFTTGSSAGIYVSAERANSNNAVSRNSILRFDPSGTGTTLTATNEWNLTADLPVTGANLGVEAITWIPDAFLTSKSFFDEAANHTYNPAEYPNHAGGVFFVGVETNGIIYAYVLDHTTNTATRIATFSTGFPAGVMALQYDRDLNYLWAVCDDGCGGLLATFEIATTGSTAGRFRITRQFGRPPSMPNLNNEGFAIAPSSECVGGRKFVYWSDDSETGGHSIRRASIACTALP